MKRLPIAGLILIASPAIVLGILLLLYGVDVPYWDQWSVIGLAEAFHLHVLTLGQLFAQFNEHRLFFPRLLALGIDALAQGNVNYELAALWLLAAITLVSIYRLAQRTLVGSSVRLLTTALLASLLIFGPIQYQNWLWGNQIALLIPVACLTAALAVSYSGLSSWIALALAATFATIATFSFANGLLCWPLLLPAQLQQFKSKAGKLRASFLWIGLAVINLASFFYHYRFLAGRPGLAQLLSQAELVITSFLAFVGSPLSFGTGINEERLAHFIGAAIMLVTALACLRFMQVRKQPAMAWRCLPWFTIGGYAFATAVIITMGRAVASPQRLLESRYTSFSVYLFVALIFLWPILFAQPDAPLPGWKRWGIEGLIAVILLLHVFTSLYAVRQMRETRTDRLQSKACLAFFNLIDDPCQTQRLDWDPILLKQRVLSLDRIGYFHPPLVRSADLKMLAGPTNPESKKYGIFEALVNVGSGFYRASGRALLPEQSRPADAVVLTYSRADGTAVAFAMADWIRDNSGWEKWFELPADADRIQAWAYDSLASRAFLLFGEQRASTAPVTTVHFAGQARGFLETGEPGDLVTVRGWAALLSKQKPADMVLLTCGDGNAIVGAGQPWSIRPDVARELRDSRYLKSGWEIPLRPQKLPPACELKAWAYDAANNEAGLLPDLRRFVPDSR